MCETSQCRYPVEEKKTQNFRIQYRRADGSRGFYFIREETADFAVTAFLLRTRNPRESVISVEVACKHHWKRAL